MTTIKLKGLDARFANVALELSHIESILKAIDPTHPALQHTMKAGLRVNEIAADCRSMLGQAIATDRRAANVLKGYLGPMLIRHYLTSQSLLGLALRHVPEDAPNGLHHRIDTLLWLCDSAKEETEIDNLLLVDVATERRRQIEKHGVQHGLTREQQASILMEEVGEVFHAINENQPEEMAKELIEVAACALKWAAEITWDKRRKEEATEYVMQPNRPEDSGFPRTYDFTGGKGSGNAANHQ